MCFENNFIHPCLACFIHSFLFIHHWSSIPKHCEFLFLWRGVGIFRRHNFANISPIPVVPLSAFWSDYFPRWAFLNDITQWKCSRTTNLSTVVFYLLLQLSLGYHTVIEDIITSEFYLNSVSVASFLSYQLFRVTTVHIVWKREKITEMLAKLIQRV